MKKIKLSGKKGQNKFALVDDEDFEKVSQYKWNFDLGYAKTSIYVKGSGRKNQKSIKIQMHRLLLNPKPNEQIDHKDRNGLNNQRSNLRICNQFQNNANFGIQNNKTGYKGVEKQTLANTFIARIRVYGKRIYLGTYKTPEEAAKAYDKAAKKHFGEFANINNI